MKSAHSAAESKKKPTDELVKIFTWKAARKLRAEAKTKKKKEVDEEEKEKRSTDEAKAM